MVAPSHRLTLQGRAGLRQFGDQRSEPKRLGLLRTGAFERAVLCVMVTTGTGWINQTAAAAIEGLWDGDTALAAMQYSYLPNWLSFLVDAERGRGSGAVLFEAIHERWSELPEDARPRLLVFGESLGADGAVAAFCERWSAFTERRDPGTHAHLPIYDGGATVRFAARAEDLQRPLAPWYEPRVVYLLHASDPVVTSRQLSADLLGYGRVPAGGRPQLRHAARPRLGGVRCARRADQYRPRRAPGCA